MKTDPLKQYVTLRDSLVKEKSQLESRLAQINRVLEDSGSTPATTIGKPRRGRPAKITAAAAEPVKRGRKAGGGRRKRNKLSLRDAIMQVTSERPLTKQEILQEVAKLGYKFKTKNPEGSINTILYSGKNFKRQNGAFSPA